MKKKLQLDLFGKKAEGYKAYDDWYSFTKAEDIRKKYQKAVKSDSDGLIYLLEKEAELRRKAGDEAGEMYCYDEMLGYCPGYAPALLNKAVILIEKKELDKAYRLLDKTYGCENQEKIWPDALVHKARIAAIRNEKEKTIEILKEAIRVNVMFNSHYHYQNFDSSYTYVRKMKEMIDHCSEFDKYRDLEGFKSIFLINYKEEIKYPHYKPQRF